jgi:transcriptional regulator with XRE-family HTH domain
MQRRQRGMSQEKLAEALGLTFQQIQKYEKGTNRISASRLSQISDVLGVAVTFAFEGAPGNKPIDGNAPSPDYIREFLATKDGLALAEAFTRLPRVKVRKSITALVEQIAEREANPLKQPRT